jgi:hypothetical protein
MNFQKLKTPKIEKTVLKDSSDNFRILDYPQLYHLWGTEVTIISNTCLIKTAEFGIFRGCYISFLQG